MKSILLLSLVLFCASSKDLQNESPAAQDVFELTYSQNHSWIDHYQTITLNHLGELKIREVSFATGNDNTKFTKIDDLELINLKLNLGKLSRIKLESHYDFAPQSTDLPTTNLRYRFNQKEDSTSINFLKAEGSPAELINVLKDVDQIITKYN